MSPVAASDSEIDRPTLNAGSARSFPRDGLQDNQSDLVHFRFADGTAVPGLLLGTCKPIETVYHCEIQPGAPHWFARTDLGGDVRRSEVVPLQETLLVRLSKNAVEVIPSTELSDGVVEVTPMQDRTFQAAPATDVAPEPFRLRLASMDLGSCTDSALDDEFDVTSALPFADSNRVVIQVLSGRLNLARVDFSLTPGVPSRVLGLPSGTYRLRTLSGPFGWWIPPQRIHVDESGVDLTIVRSRMILVQPADGWRTRTPKATFIRVEWNRPGDPPSTGDVALRHRFKNGELVVSVDEIPTPDASNTYRVVVVWWDKTESTSASFEGPVFPEVVELLAR